MADPTWKYSVRRHPERNLNMTEMQSRNGVKLFQGKYACHMDDEAASEDISNSLENNVKVSKKSKKNKGKNASSKAKYENDDEPKKIESSQKTGESMDMEMNNSFEDDVKPSKKSKMMKSSMGTKYLSNFFHLNFDDITSEDMEKLTASLGDAEIARSFSLIYKNNAEACEETKELKIELEEKFGHTIETTMRAATRFDNHKLLLRGPTITENQFAMYKEITRASEIRRIKPTMSHPTLRTYRFVFDHHKDMKHWQHKALKFGRKDYRFSLLQAANLQSMTKSKTDAEPITTKDNQTEEKGRDDTKESRKRKRSKK